jgi:flagellar biosynthesis GTPase FlhF
METKRFIGNETARLYDRVRAEFGPDAVIVRTRTLMREGGDPLIEITAAAPSSLDVTLPLDAQEAVFEGALDALARERGGLTVGQLEALVAPAPPATASSPPANVLNHPHHETARPASVIDLATRARPVAQSGVVAALQEAGFTTRAARLIAEASADGDPAAAVEAFFAAREPDLPVEGEASLITVQGMAGSGRTTALMKLALDCADSGVATVLIAADPATRDEVQAFGLALGLPVYDAFTPAQLTRVLLAAPPAACMFADVPAGRWAFAGVAAVAHYPFLAIPADRSTRVLSLALSGTPEGTFAGALITLADNSGGLAPALSLAAELGLGVAFISAGSDIAGGIEIPEPTALASGVLTTTPRETTNGRSFATA